MQNEFPKTLEENERYRLTVLQESDDDLELQGLLMANCRNDIIYFINVFCWTYDPRRAETNIPFVTYEYQDDYILNLVKCIEEDKDSFTEKSRDMGFSWMIVAIQVWAFLFKKYSSLYGSYKEDYVDHQGNMDSHFERIRYILERLPQWMKPSDLVDKYMTVSSAQLAADISGDTGQNFGTGGRRKFVVLDEFALWGFDEKAFRKTADITKCRIFGGTPEGSFNIYGKVMTNHPDYRHMDFEKYRLHWTLHPDKNQEWYDKEKLKRTPLDVAKELDISYDDSVTGQVYKNFTTIVKFGEYQFDPKRPLYTAWDFGRDTTAIIWIQKDWSTDTCYVVDAYKNVDKDIDFYASFLTGFPLPTFVYDENELAMIEKHAAWKHAYFSHYGDPYNVDSRNVLSENTIGKQLNKHGINIISNRLSRVEDRINKTQLALNRLFVNKDLTDFIQAMVQSRYPKESENSQATGEKLKPVHDASSHFRTALEYFFDNEPKKVKSDASEIKEYIKSRATKNLIPNRPTAGWARM